MSLVVRDVDNFQVLTEDEAQALVVSGSIVACDGNCMLRAAPTEQVYHQMNSWWSFERDLELVRNSIAAKS